MLTNGNGATQPITHATNGNGPSEALHNGNGECSSSNNVESGNMPSQMHEINNLKVRHTDSLN